MPPEGDELLRVWDQKVRFTTCSVEKSRLPKDGSIAWVSPTILLVERHSRDPEPYIGVVEIIAAKNQITRPIIG